MSLLMMYRPSTGAPIVFTPDPTDSGVGADKRRALKREYVGRAKRRRQRR